MTLLVVILSITNIALGYGLAIYLGHAQSAPKTVRAARSQQAKEQAPVVEEAQSEPLAATPPRATVAYEPIVEPVAPEPIVMSPVAEALETVAPPPQPVAAVAEVPPAASAAAPEVAPVEPATEEAVLKQIDEVRNELHETPAPATMVEALAAEQAPAGTEPISEEEAAAKPVSKEALLESINAFQAQLKKQQELAKLHAVTSQS